MVLLIVLWGLLYSVPNLYPDDEALQITTEGLSLNSADIEVVTTALEAAQVEFFGVEGNDTNLLVRFDSVEDQLRAKTAIEDALGADYIVALNLAPTTPNWMQAIGAGKMNLGLDLHALGQRERHGCSPEDDVRVERVLVLIWSYGWTD